MSMHARLRPISVKALNAWLAEPKLSHEVVSYEPGQKAEAAPDFDARLAEALEAVEGLPRSGRAAAQKAARRRVAQQRAHWERSQPTQLEEQLAKRSLGPKDFGPILELGQAWDALHFALTGSRGRTRSVVSRAMLGATAHGKELGYGPALYVTAKQVKAIAAALDEVEEKALVARLSGELTEFLYCFETGADPQWVVQTFVELRRFYRSAAKAGRAVLFWIV